MSVEPSKKKSTSTTVINVTDVSFSYGVSPVLESVDLDVMANEFLAIVGPNGGGKSTLLRLLLGSLTPSEGRITVLGDTPLRSVQRIGYVPQNTSVGLDVPVSVLDVARMGRLGCTDRGKDNAVVQQSLEMSGMWELKDEMIGALSGGQRQRALLARAFATEPEILMLDEPTANVDPHWQGRLYDILKSMTDSITVIAASHDITGVMGYVDRIAYVNRSLHTHSAPAMTHETIESLSGTSIERLCPVELIAKIIEDRSAGCE